MSDIITRILISKKEAEERVRAEDATQLALKLKGGGYNQGSRQPLEAGKRQENGFFPRGSRKEHNPAGILTSAQ